jgi:hypothetical protein
MVDHDLIPAIALLQQLVCVITMIVELDILLQLGQLFEVLNQPMLLKLRHLV